MANTESSEKAGRIIVRLFFIVLACVLLLMGYDHYKPLVVGNDRPLTDGGCAGLLYFRDRRIDRLEPTVTQGSADPDAAAQARAAADALKELFKSQEISYGLCAVRYDEETSRRLLAQTPQPEDGGCYLALVCDYNVYDDTGEDKAGYYPDAVFVLRRQADGSWTLPASRRESELLSPLVCSLEQRLCSEAGT